MSVERELIRAMMENPEDLDLRLVLADWYQEHGDPRGEFIQVQIALDRLPKQHWWREDFQVRERELLVEHRKEWDAPLHRHLNHTVLKGKIHSRRGAVRGWEYRRGFVEHLSVEAGTAMDRFDTFLSLGPLRSLRLWNARNVLPRLSRWEGLSRFLKLDLRHNDLGDAGLADFLQSPHLSQLEELSLVDAGLTDLSAEVLTSQEFLPAFQRLVVSQNPFSQTGWEQLLLRYGDRLRHENGTSPLRKTPRRIEANEPEFVSYDDELLYDSGHIDTEGKRQVDGEWVEGYDEYDGFAEFDEEGLKHLGGYIDSDQSDRWIGPNRESDLQQSPWEEEEG